MQLLFEYITLEKEDKFKLCLLSSLFLFFMNNLFSKLKYVHVQYKCNVIYLLSQFNCKVKPQVISKLITDYL